MPGLYPKPEFFQRGEVQISAEALNKIIRAVVREVRGGGRTRVGYMGDRVFLHSDEIRTQLPDAGLYLAQFVVMEEQADLLKCCYFDQPTAGSLNELWKPRDFAVPNVQTTPFPIYVAKPYSLQQTPLEGATITLNGTPTTLHYTGVGQRTANGTAQTIQPGYFPGEILLCGSTFCGYYDPDLLARNPPEQSPVVWQDLNLAGRQYQGAVASTFTGCRLNTGAVGISVPNNTPILMTWDAITTGQNEFDTGGYFDSGNPTYLTIPTTGYYAFTVNPSLSSIPVSIGRLISYLYNGTNISGTLIGVWYDPYNRDSAGNNVLYPSHQAVAYLTAGDKIRLYLAVESTVFPMDCFGDLAITFLGAAP